MSGTLSFLSSEFSSALEYLKLLNSFVDSVGIVTPPFSSSSVLKSALGKHLAGGSTGLRLLDSVLHSPCVLGPRIGYESATQEPSLALRCVSAVPTSAHPQFPLLGCVLGAGNQDAARSGMTSESGTLAGAGQECSQVLRMGSKWSGPGGWWGASPFGTKWSLGLLLGLTPSAGEAFHPASLLLRHPLPRWPHNCRLNWQQDALLLSLNCHPGDNMRAAASRVAEAAGEGVELPLTALPMEGRIPEEQPPHRDL